MSEVSKRIKLTTRTDYEQRQFLLGKKRTRHRLRSGAYYGAGGRQTGKTMWDSPPEQTSEKKQRN